MSCDPEFVIHERCPGDEALLLACDGLWDVLDNSEAIAGIRRNFSQGKTLMTDVAENMLDVSLSRGALLIHRFTTSLIYLSPLIL